MKSDSKTIELVGPGHADRFCDYLAEEILMAHLKQDPHAHVAVEIMATRNKIFLGGEITSHADIPYEEIVYKTIEFIYGNKWWPEYKKNVKVINNIKKQSRELDKIQKKEIVAGDQGVMYGYYSKHRYKIINFLYEFVKYLKDILKEKFNAEIAHDWKLLFNEKIGELSISVCGIKNAIINAINNYFKNLKNSISLTELESKLVKINILINPMGEWFICGPQSDTGMVGRKLMIDTFGAGIPHGGGAFCGKDFSKVDKSGVIIATEIAKHLAIKKNIEEVYVQLTYKIGDSIPKINAVDLLNSKEILTSEYIKDLLTLDQWIKRRKIIENNWSNIAFNGGIIYYFNSNRKNN